MATSLKRVVVRKCERPSRHNGRRLIVILEPGDIIGMREEGRRTTYKAPLEKVFFVLARWHADEEIRRKKEEKKQRKEMRKIVAQSYGDN
jgi:hypothetical protein